MEHIPGPPHFLKSKVFFKKLIAFYLFNDKKGEVISERYYQRDVIRKNYKYGFSVTSALTNRLSTSLK